MAKSFQPYNNGPFSNTYDNKKNKIGQIPLDTINDENKSRQSMNNLNTFNSSKSNQFTNTQQSNRLIDE